MLKATERDKGGRPQKTGHPGKPVSEPTLSDLGLGRPPKIGPSPELGPKNDKPTLRVTERAKLDEEVKKKEANDA